MNSRNELIEKLNQVISKGQILTDLEDLYVYSYEKIFSDQKYIKPDIVVRVSSSEEENELKKLVKRRILS